MSGSAVIGALRVVFDADNDNFNQALDESNGKVGILEDSIKQLTDRLRDAGVKIAAVGAGLSAALTLPLTGLAHSAVQTAAQFESAMKRVESALDNVSADQLKALENQARTMGPAVGRGATEAATAIESLARNGLDAANILGGGLAAALKLAAAGQTELAPAADATTDIMQQFGKTAGDLGPVVDKIVGAMNASKFGFQDFQLAIGQAGGVAGAVGVTFEDFNTALAGTSALFGSGSDAGTSFKTFLTSLSGNSKQAKKEMADLGLTFFDTATHKMKPMADVAETLRTSLGGLSEQARTKVLTDVFGTDGMRTAIGLMKLGKDGFVDLQNTIASASADKQVGKMQEGYAAAVARLAAAFENLKIAIGQSGLLDIMTSFMNSVTRLVSGLANLSPHFMRITAGFAAVAAAAGPLLVVLGGALYFAVGVFLRTLGPLGWAISALIEPIGTLVAAGLRFVAWAGARAILRAMAGAFLELTGPIGWAITAIILFKDYIITALEQVWQAMVTRLGPPVEAIFAKLGSMFASISGGPIGGAVSWLVSAIGVIVDVIGVTLAGALELAGNLIVRVLGVIVAAVGGVVNVVSDVVNVISALLSGDFAGAWEAAKQIVSDVFDAIVNMAVALAPELTTQLRVAYGAAKAWLADGFTAIGSWLSTAVAGMVNYVASAFPNIVAAAKSVYEGVKGWLVDKFGTLLGWIGTAAKYISDRFGEVKKALGFGGTQAAPPPPVPAVPKAPAVTPVPKSNYMPSDDDDKKTRTKKGRDTSHDELNREELELQAQLAAARARGDGETERRIQDQLDLTKQIEAYQRTGLGLTEARNRAERDMKDLQAARAEKSAKEVSDQQRAVNLEVAKLDKNVLLADNLERQAELQQRIAKYRQDGLTLAQATAQAEADQQKMDDARGRVRAKWFEDDADARALRLAQVRGDSDEEIRQLERVIAVKKRSADLEAQHVDPDAAKRQANAEADAEEQARQQGKFRDLIKGGFKAALDGDIGDWFKNWWKDKVAKGMEQALNSLADLIASLFSKSASSASGGGGGGILGSIASAIGGLFGKKGGGSAGAAVTDTNAWMGFNEFDGFATGGAFEVGGRSGIDQNLIAFRATAGEKVNITRPGNDNGPNGSMTVYAPLQLTGAVDLATQDYANRIAMAHAQNVRQAIAEADRRRG